MENKKKQLIYLGILGVCILIMGWVWFGPGVPSSGSALETSLLTDLTTPASGGGLPYGTDFDLKILEDVRFKSLVPVSALQVTPEELGRVNPFLRLGSDIATTTP